MSQDLIIKIMADYSLIPIVLLGTFSLIFYIPKGRRFAAYRRILMAGLTAYFLAKIASVIYQQAGQRPFEVIGTSAKASFLNNPGFPSDHALFITAILCAVWFETKKKAISIIIASLILVVCVGRVLALVHTPVDVIGGVAIALVASVWYIFARPKTVTK